MSFQVQPSIGKDPAIRDISQSSIPGHPPAGFRPLQPGESGGEIGRAALSILNSSELGDQTPFTIDGILYMGRTEPHFHPYPPKGTDPADYGKYPKPWGWHKGVTVFKSEEGATQPGMNYMPQQPSNSQTRMKLLQRMQDSPDDKLEELNQLLSEMGEEL